MEKIKSMKSWVDDGGEPFLKSFIEFDENGNEIIKETYFGYEDLESKTVANYNEKGLLIEEINYDENGNETDRTNVERDNEGHPVQTIITYADGSKTIKSYLREEDGKSITIFEESDEGEFESMEKIRLDDKGNVIERITYNENEEITEQHQFVFDDDQNIINEAIFRGKVKVSESKHFYDEKKNLIKRIQVNSTGETIDWALYKYNESGKLVEQQYGDYSLYKMEYNEKGIVVMEQKVNSMGVVDYSKEYVYNESGELVEEIDLKSKTTFEYQYF